MTTSHTPGRLRLERDTMHFDSMSSIRGGEHRNQLGLSDELMVEVGGWSRSQEANARRLVACWNALDGISTGKVESISAMGGFPGAVGELMAQRDELLDALRMVLDDPNALDGRPLTAECVRAAIAKAEGNA